MSQVLKLSVGVSALAFVLGCAGTAKNASITTGTRNIASQQGINVVQSIDFSSDAGVSARARIVDYGPEGGDAGLQIVHTVGPDGQEDVVLETGKLGINLPGAQIDPTKLGANKEGLTITNYGQGRDRYTRTLTVQYHDGQYVLARFSYSFHDTLTGKKDNCDYNLLTGEGKRNKRDVKVSRRILALALLEDSESLYTCSRW